MSRVIMLIPTEAGVGLTSVSLGMMHAIRHHTIKVSLFNPIMQSQSLKLEESPAEPLEMAYVEKLISLEQKAVLMEEIIERYQKINKQAKVVLVQGIAPTSAYPFANQLNYDIAKTLGAEIIFVMSLDPNLKDQLGTRIEMMRAYFGGRKNDKIIGAIINKINAPIDSSFLANLDTFGLHGDDAGHATNKIKKLSEISSLPIIGAIPWNVNLSTGRAVDIANYLQAQMINEGKMYDYRIKYVSFCTQAIPEIIPHFRDDTLLVVPNDRLDILLTACLAVVSGVQIGAILLTGGVDVDSSVSGLVKKAFSAGLPVFAVDSDSLETAVNLQNFKLTLSDNDKKRLENVQHFIADHVDSKWINSLKKGGGSEGLLSPPAFRYQITQLACNAKKRIVLPEGDEPRTIKAAAICAERLIAKCILLGNRAKIKSVAAAHGIELPKGIEIIEADNIREHYVERLVELRKSKGMTKMTARNQLLDNVVLATMMLEQNEIDGLVSGAVHTTANTIRPALQIIKTTPDCSLVSSVFFMLMPDQVYIYGDCAINPNPTASQLAEIAIQSADTAVAFGIDPRIAMISYSTGSSGTGDDVEKVKEATRIAKQKRPDLVLDGPLQYDASVIPDVAKSKAQGSPVAGRANVFIFPDLNTGNTTYKAVQRAANIVSIGPMLQGMRKPVNDLSRGASVDDIVYTIALTAIQAAQS